jgi:hypothetical protein
MMMRISNSFLPGYENQEKKNVSWYFFQDNMPYLLHSSRGLLNILFFSLPTIFSADLANSFVNSSLLKTAGYLLMYSISTSARFCFSNCCRHFFYPIFYKFFYHLYQETLTVPSNVTLSGITLNELPPLIQPIVITAGCSGFNSLLIIL